METNQKLQLEKLAATLVTVERFGKLAVAPVVEQLPFYATEEPIFGD